MIKASVDPGLNMNVCTNDPSNSRLHSYATQNHITFDRKKHKYESKRILFYFSMKRKTPLFITRSITYSISHSHTKRVTIRAPVRYREGRRAESMEMQESSKYT